MTLAKAVASIFFSPPGEPDKCIFELGTLWEKKSRRWRKAFAVDLFSCLMTNAESFYYRKNIWKDTSFNYVNNRKDMILQ